MIKDRDNKDNRIRLALISAGAELKLLFPELFPTDEDTEDESDEDFPDSGGPIKYDFSHAEFDPKEAEEMMRNMVAQAATGTTHLETDRM